MLQAKGSCSVLENGQTAKLQSVIARAIAQASELVGSPAAGLIPVNSDFLAQEPVLLAMERG